MRSPQHKGRQIRRRRFLRLLANKYVLTLGFFAVWITLFDTNSLINIYTAKQRVANLTEKAEYYQRQISQDSARLQELQTNNATLEKFAREQYFMRSANEDLYVVE